MMTVVQHDVQIEASPQETGALLIDASRWPDWFPGVTEIDIVAPFPEVGGKVTYKFKQAGRSMPTTSTVLDYQPGKLAVFQLDARGFSGRERWELGPEGDGTRVTATLDYLPLGGVFGKIADALIFKRMTAKVLEKGLHNAKALIERQ